MRAKQFDFFEYHNLKDVKKRYGRTIYGGCDSRGHRKLERPLSTRKPMHLLLKSDKAKGTLSLRAAKNRIYIRELLKEKAQKFGVRIHEQINMGNHLHLKLSITSRELFQKFLKAITAMIARFVTGARKGKRFGRFWQGLAFTRVLQTTKEELYLRGYFQANALEKFSGTHARKDFLKRFRHWVYRERLRERNAPS